MGLLKKLFIFVLFLFPLAEVVRINLGNDIVVRPFDIGVGLIAFLWFIFKLKKRESVKQKYILAPIFLFSTAGIFSLLINYSSLSSNQFFASLLYLIRWIVYSSIFFVVSDFDKDFKKRIINLLLIVGGLIVGLGYIQYFLYPNLKNLFYLGWDEHMHRVFSTFLDPNFAGAFFVLYLIFLLGIFSYLLRNNKIKHAWLIGLISFFTLIAIFMTFSRSALIMLFTSIIIFSILTKKIKWIFELILILVIFVFLSSKSFYVENINLFRIVSTQARIYSAKTAIRIIRDNPFLGVGFNAYRYAQIKYGFTNVINYSHADAGTDNSFLFVFATTGIIGLILYLNLIVRIVMRSYVNYRIYTNKNIKKYIAITVVASMAGIIIDSFFINSIFYSFIMIWMWILLGLISLGEELRENK